MAHIPNDAIFGGVEDIMQGYREFHGAQVGTQMPPGLRHVVEDALAKFNRYLWQISAF